MMMAGAFPSSLNLKGLWAKLMRDDGTTNYSTDCVKAHLRRHVHTDGDYDGALKEVAKFLVRRQPIRIFVSVFGLGSGMKLLPEWGCEVLMAALTGTVPDAGADIVTWLMWKSHLAKPLLSSKCDAEKRRKFLDEFFRGAVSTQAVRTLLRITNQQEWAYKRGHVQRGTRPLLINTSAIQAVRNQEVGTAEHYRSWATLAELYSTFYGTTFPEPYAPKNLLVDFSSSQLLLQTPILQEYEDAKSNERVDRQMRAVQQAVIMGLQKLGWNNLKMVCERSESSNCECAVLYALQNMTLSRHSTLLRKALAGAFGPPMIEHLNGVCKATTRTVAFFSAEGALKNYVPSSTLLELAQIDSANNKFLIEFSTSTKKELIASAYVRMAIHALSTKTRLPRATFLSSCTSLFSTFLLYVLRSCLHQVGYREPKDNIILFLSILCKQRVNTIDALGTDPSILDHMYFGNNLGDLTLHQYVQHIQDDNRVEQELKTATETAVALFTAFITNPYIRMVDYMIEQKFEYVDMIIEAQTLLPDLKAKKEYLQNCALTTCIPFIKKSTYAKILPALSWRRQAYQIHLRDSILPLKLTSFHRHRLGKNKQAMLGVYMLHNRNNTIVSSMPLELVEMIFAFLLYL